MRYDSYARMRPATTRLMEMMDEGLLDSRAVADMALMYLSENSVREMIQANDISLGKNDHYSNEDEDNQVQPLDDLDHNL